MLIFSPESRMIHNKEAGWYQKGGSTILHTLNIVVLTSRTQVISLEIPTRTVRTDVLDQLLKLLIELMTSHVYI